MIRTIRSGLLLALILTTARAQTTTVLHASRLLDVETGRLLSPGELLIRGDRIVESGTSVSHPQGADTIDLGDRTLLPGLIDAHEQEARLHLFYTISDV